MLQTWRKKKINDYASWSILEYSYIKERNLKGTLEIFHHNHTFCIKIAVERGSNKLVPIKISSIIVTCSIFITIHAVFIRFILMYDYFNLIDYQRVTMYNSVYKRLSELHQIYLILFGFTQKVHCQDELN